MAYDEDAAARIRASLGEAVGLTEKKMFGGLAFLHNGNMCCGMNGKVLMLRLGEAGTTDALKEPHARPMDFTGKPLKTMVFVDPPGYAKDEDLSGWVDHALGFARTLPPK